MIHLRRPCKRTRISLVALSRLVKREEVDARRDIALGSYDASFTGVHSCPHVEAERLHSVDDRSAAPYGTRGTIESRKESVPGGPYPCNALIVREQGVMRLDEFTPRAITERGYSLSRADQVGEEDGCENAFQLGFFLERREEVLKLSQHAFPIPREAGMLFAGQFDDACLLQLASDDDVRSTLTRIVGGVPLTLCFFESSLCVADRSCFGKLPPTFALRLR